MNISKEDGVFDDGMSLDGDGGTSLLPGKLPENDDGNAPVGGTADVCAPLAAGRAGFDASGSPSEWRKKVRERKIGCLDILTPAVPPDGRGAFSLAPCRRSVPLCHPRSSNVRPQSFTNPLS
jgi:hypothetical protein